MEIWPETVPAPNFESRNSFLNGIADDQDVLRAVRTRTYPERELSVTLDLTQTEFLAFKAWFDDTLNAGCEMFSASWLVNAGFSHHLARVSGNGYQASRQGVRWSVGLTLEVIADIPANGMWTTDDTEPVVRLGITMPILEYTTTVVPPP